ncbi:histidine phosphatase family protein [Arcobacter sp. LA11]|uniref:histidine phosphatase family protein n=1 Tax=Arcobacter sp. LA11 TaxID=1898176 RepID=UPI00093436D1|nr:histidine phosphatase family protein [Arcobacter sp. LA11]
MVLITLLRHAPLALKYQNRYIGHTDISIDKSLTDISKLDIIKNRKYDYIYSSDLLRCTETLDLIGFDYVKDARLREIRFKEEFEGKSFAEVAELDSYNMKYLSSMKSWHKYIADESLDDFENRIKDFLENLPKDGDILICSHGGTIKMLHSIFEKKSYHNSLLKVNYIEPIDFIL